MSILTIGTSRKLYRTCNILQNINIPTYLTGLQIRFIFGGIRIQQIRILKTGSGSQILLALTKNQFKHLNVFHNKILLLIFEWWLFLSEKNGKIHQKICKISIFKILFPCLYNFTLPKYRNRPKFVHFSKFK